MDLSSFEPLNRQIVEDIKAELRDQGHYDLGELERSFEDLITETKRGFVLNASALGYLQDLELGVDAKDIDEKKIDINKLAGWVGRKVSSENQHGIARAIIQKWKKVGKPSWGGNNLLAIEQVFIRNKSYTNEIDDLMIDQFDSEVLMTKSGII